MPEVGKCLPAFLVWVETIITQRADTGHVSLAQQYMCQGTIGANNSRVLCNSSLLGISCGIKAGIGSWASSSCPTRNRAARDMSSPGTRHPSLVTEKVYGQALTWACCGPAWDGLMAGQDKAVGSCRLALLRAWWDWGWWPQADVVAGALGRVSES